MVSIAKSAAIVTQAGRLAVRGKNPKLRGAAGSRKGGGRREVEGKQSGGSKYGPARSGDRQQGRYRHGPAGDDKKPAQDEKDDDKEESGEKENHLSPPASPGPPLTWKRQPFC